MLKIKNLYNCAINVENHNERMGLLIYLHLIGYKVLNFNNLSGLYQSVELNKSIVIDDHIVNVGHKITEEWVCNINKDDNRASYYSKKLIFCENSAIFEAIAAINNETDYAQWFTYKINGKIFWIKAYYDKIERQIFDDEVLKTLRKATVEEIKEYFKNGYVEN